MILKQFLRFSELSSGKNRNHNSELDHQTEVQPRWFVSTSLFSLTACSARCQQVKKDLHSSANQVLSPCRDNYRSGMTAFVLK